MHDGDPDDWKWGMVRDPKTGKKVKAKVPKAQGVHTAFEDDMVNYHVVDLMQAIEAASKKNPLALVKSGKAAAVATVELMRRSFDRLPPKKLVSSYKSVLDDKPKERAEALWSRFGEATSETMIDGCQTLAMLWDSAWALGGGDQKVKQLKELTEASVRTVYLDRTFIPSYTISHIESALSSAPKGTPKAGGGRKKKKKKGR